MILIRKYKKLLFPRKILIWSSLFIPSKVESFDIILLSQSSFQVKKHWWNASLRIILGSACNLAFISSIFWKRCPLSVVLGTRNRSQWHVREILRLQYHNDVVLLEELMNNCAKHLNISLDLTCSPWSYLLKKLPPYFCNVVPSRIPTFRHQL